MFQTLLFLGRETALACETGPEIYHTAVFAGLYSRFRVSELWSPFLSASLQFGGWEKIRRPVGGLTRVVASIP